MTGLEGSQAAHGLCPRIDHKTNGEQTDKAGTGKSISNRHETGLQWADDARRLEQRITRP